MSWLLQIFLTALLTFQPMTHVFAGMLFDDVDDSISLPAESSFGVEAGPLTMGCWVYFSGPPSSASREGRLIGTTTAAGEVFIHRVDSAANPDTVFFFKDFATNNLNVRASDNAVTEDAWHLVVATWDGGATASNTDIYVDGTEVSYELQQNGTGSEVSGSALSWIIGDATVGGGSRSIEGTVSECAVWSVELSAQEVALWSSSRTRNLPLQIQPASLKAYYRLDDGPNGDAANGDVVTDYARVAGNGTGDDGAGNAGLTWQAEAVLSYP